MCGRAAGSSLDFYSPTSTTRALSSGPAAIIATATRSTCRKRAAARPVRPTYLRIGRRSRHGLSPFAIESEANDKDPLRELQHPRQPRAICSSTEHRRRAWLCSRPRHHSVDFTMNGYTLHVSLDNIFGEPRRAALASHGRRQDGFLVPAKASASALRHAPTTPSRGIAAVDEAVVDGKWVAGRRLNGDENDQGAYWRFDPHQEQSKKLRCIDSSRTRSRPRGWTPVRPLGPAPLPR